MLTAILLSEIFNGERSVGEEFGSGLQMARKASASLADNHSVALVYLEPADMSTYTDEKRVRFQPTESHRRGSASLYMNMMCSECAT